MLGIESGDYPLADRIYREYLYELDQGDES
jgi:hypothetical protein